jgi:uncharacterized protein (TIGR02246 family)
MRAGGRLARLTSKKRGRDNAAANDAVAICKTTAAAYNTAVPTGDPAKMAAVFAPDAELVTPWGLMAGRDAIIKYYASYMKAGDKQIDTFTSSRLIGDIALCTGTFNFAPASGDANKGNWTKVAGKVGGEWKILNLTYNFAAPE